jgi:signal transduction histidine kinase
VAFAVIIGIFQYSRERQYKVNKLENKLHTYINLINNFIELNKNSRNNFSFLDSLILVFPEKDMRITVVNCKGKVLFDSYVDSYSTMENHLNRKEIIEAEKNGTGKSVRLSSTTNIEYFYFAAAFNDYYIRTALPYNVKVENYLKANTYFIYVILLIFIIFSVMIIYMSDKLGKTISTLQEFARHAALDKEIDIETKFPKNELGFIGNKIVEVYNKLQKTKKELSAEREKLFRHLQISREGIAIFTKEKTLLLANNHFIQYLNIISDQTAVSPDSFSIKELQPVYYFIDNNINKKHKTDNFSSRVLTINKNGKFYEIQAIVFKDKSFEISINDVTRFEKEKQLKQQMTSNISHELKTPVSSILGYLETILTSKMPDDKKRFFLERSYFQTQRLADLIQDISLLNKIEEASDLFSMENTDIKEPICLAIDDLRSEIEEKNILVNNEVPEKKTIKANKSILYSVWRNLIENSIKYGGENININIKLYHEDDKFLYFSYSDTGVGIPEKHLHRIFERFYRIDSGRARITGGTGLGLAIVKNGIIFHKGDISVKTPDVGGVEFIFTISKKINIPF